VPSNAPSLVTGVKYEVAKVYLVTMHRDSKLADISVNAARYERMELVGSGSFGEVYRG